MIRVEFFWSGMSGVSFPVTRPSGRALVVGSESSRPQAVALLQRLGFHCAELDDPYLAAAELARRPLVYRALILSLASVYKEELALIGMVKRRMPHIEIWLAHTDGRQAALAEAMRLGADGLLAEDGLHRVAMGAPPAVEAPKSVAPSQPQAERERDLDEAEEALGAEEPVLSADELRALLQEQVTLPGDES
jgi:hypothetical protein